MSEHEPLAPRQRHAAALAALGAGPRRLRRFLEGFTPTAAWEAIACGNHPADPERRYQHKAVATLRESVASACERAGASVSVRGDSDYPTALASDPEAPAVLFALGEPTVCDGAPAVAVVGTRSASSYGRAVARELGKDLAEAGLVVVSGLARGIDEAAHAGALEATRGAAFAVLGKALDGRLCGSRQALRIEIARRGAVVSELPPGVTGAPAWWFAVRNRLMAAVAHLVVVIECHARGGALHTVRYARERGVQVAAVPGSVRSAASAGTNALLVEGAHTVRDAGDVIALLDRFGVVVAASAPGARRGDRVDNPERQRLSHRADVAASCVLSALDQDPATLDAVVLRCGLSLGETALALEELLATGLAQNEGGWWSRIG